MRASIGRPRGWRGALRSFPVETGQPGRSWRGRSRRLPGGVRTALSGWVPLRVRIRGCGDRLAARQGAGRRVGPAVPPPAKAPPRPALQPARLPTLDRPSHPFLRRPGPAPSFSPPVLAASPSSLFPHRPQPLPLVRPSEEESSAESIDSSALCGRPAPNSSVCSELDFPRRRPRRRRQQRRRQWRRRRWRRLGQYSRPPPFRTGSERGAGTEGGGGARGSAAPRCGREVRGGPPLLGPCPGPDPLCRRRAGPAASE